jgi:hypothetical protein
VAKPALFELPPFLFKNVDKIERILQNCYFQKGCMCHFFNELLEIITPYVFGLSFAIPRIEKAGFLLD